jgi:polar amino acid transport system substrate-binding protein
VPSPYFLFVCSAFPSFAQDEALSFATVERLPFATQVDGFDMGFSLELIREIFNQLRREITFEFYDSFPAMLSSLDEGLHDCAVVNISISSDCESYLDFSHPIFEGGFGVLFLDKGSSGGTVAKFGDASKN